MATNRFKIRRGSSIPSTANLESFELGYVTGSGRLYINANGTMRQVGGTVSQAAVSSSSTHDQIPTALAVYNYGNGAFLKLTGGTISGNVTIAGTLLMNDLIRFGTDAIRSASAGNMLFFGNNPGVVDTVANWTAKGFGWAWISATEQVTDQPSQYGFLLNIPINTSGTECHQMFMVQSGNAIYHRGGDTSGWASAWKQMWDSTNMPLPLGISQGGTGRTDGKVAALVTPRQINGVNFDGTGNITITANPNAHNHSASNITSDTLGTARGGTGQTSLQATRNAMGLGNTTGALPIANGGTGATTASGAIANLGYAANMVIYSATTPAVVNGKLWLKPV